MTDDKKTKSKLSSNAGSFSKNEVTITSNILNRDGKNNPPRPLKKQVSLNCFVFRKYLTIWQCCYYTNMQKKWRNLSIQARRF